ncbi:ATP-binding protein [Paenibacillus alvei]|uniref:ATP-binding protein n=1 Tax=Paenibacillus alvei TaxID=44250 RepID=A0ABT4H2P6_PAEAL|nr:ATP-binding protein [Paenibacillus alvei]MCY9763256.1 ATP-binding protein [Paenibacillus alvei]MCY9769455.1 ATP-binding protein [Paenibacillus alvei]
MILPFELDPQIIHHIIHSQAGSIGKAIIELIMNSVDANAKSVQLKLTREGFSCSDDGAGFASKEDVLRYFGRFGTPHIEGDATYGRFRLGRGQIMAHASTVWISNQHQMIVDTKSMGYNYELEELELEQPGCHITGTWYEPLTEGELLSSIQEIRDLIRYTPASVELNDRVITRDPLQEQWDFEDEYAYYRVKVEGAVSIYNQGVLVRHDASHIWGAGGLIVSKKAISLNVSRTEILRKTCPVWQVIAKQFGEMAEEIASKLGDHRKTEARREKSARSLLAGDGKMWDLIRSEEVVTILPGNRHITLDYFFRRVRYDHQNSFCIVENNFDIPKAETMAKAKITMFLHPRTMERFGVYSPEQFLDCLDQISDNYKRYCEQNDYSFRGNLFETRPQLVEFSGLSEAFVERMQILEEREHLDREARRPWTALRWCLQQYAGACLHQRRYRNGRVAYDEKTFSILLGSSNTAEAWTDGESYIAFNVAVVKKLKGDPLKTAAYMFSLLEHEIAHEGDSIDVGHDEAFYQRYHDISVEMSSERQRYMHMWLMKYTTSLEYDGKKAAGIAWRERLLLDRVGNGREKKGLTRIEDVSQDPVVLAHVPAENVALIASVNTAYYNAGLCPEEPNWAEVLERSKYDEEKSRQNNLSEDDDEDEYFDLMHEEHMKEMKLERERICKILNIESSELAETAFYDLCYESEENIIALWGSKPWEWRIENEEISSDEPSQVDLEEMERNQDPRTLVSEKYHHLIRPGETKWSLERNSAAAGFMRTVDYLIWRGEE